MHTLLFIRSFTRRSIGRNVRLMTGEIFPIVWKCLFNLFRLVGRGSLEAPLVGRNYSSNGLLSRNVSTFVEGYAEMTKSSVCTRHQETWKNCRLVILSLHLPKPSICFLVAYCYDLLEKDYTPNERVILYVSTFYHKERKLAKYERKFNCI